MLNRARNLLSTVFFAMPALPFRTWILNRLGHSIDRGSKVGAILVTGDVRLVTAPGARICSMTRISACCLVRLHANAFVGPWNFISANPAMRVTGTHAGSLVLGESAKITNRHNIDCSGGVSLGRFASIAGSGSLVQSHQIDLTIDAQTAEYTSIGDYVFVGSRAIVLMGVHVPARSVVGAGAVVHRLSHSALPGLYAGVPARYVRPVAGAWFSRENTHTLRVFSRTGTVQR